MDRELNNFAMRLKEWYGWHFPELSKIVTDNLVYARVVQKIGFRTNAKNADIEALIPDEVSRPRRVHLGALYWAPDHCMASSQPASTAP